MSQFKFLTADGVEIPAVNESQMREVDRIAVEHFGLGVLQMMENAGRTLALAALALCEDDGGEVLVLAGPGGNGGGGIACARHLHNHGISVQVVLSKPEEQLAGPLAAQWRILKNAGIRRGDNEAAAQYIERASLVVDALLGYSLKGAPSGEIRRLIALTGALAKRVLSLDIPSGTDATTGKRPGAAITPVQTMTLALPKTGLTRAAGSILLADIGIPPEVYHPLGISFSPFFHGNYHLPLSLV